MAVSATLATGLAPTQLNAAILATRIGPYLGVLLIPTILPTALGRAMGHVNRQAWVGHQETRALARREGETHVGSRSL